MAIDLQRLNEIDIKNIGTAPTAIKVAIIGVLCAVVFGVGYMLDLQGQLAALSAARAKEATLKASFEEKQNKAANLEPYQRQMKEMEDSFGTMLRQLPSKTEVADLLIDITQTGLASGLTFDLFKPENERPLDFYAELPIALQVSGGYHDFGAFASGVAALPRIVTLHDISISAQDKGKGKGSATGNGLVMKATAKTYRYLDAAEIAAAAAKERAKAKKGK